VFLGDYLTPVGVLFLPESNIRLRFIDSGSSIVGVAFNKNDDVVVCFSFQIEEGRVDSEGRS